MIVGELKLPIIDAICQRDAAAKIDRFQVANVIERESRQRSGLDVELPALRMKRIIVAVA